MASERRTCGQLLRHFRQLARLTQEELAARSGYSANYLSKLERDQRQPPPVALDRLADVLGLGRPEHDQLRAAREQSEPAPEPQPPLVPEPLAPPQPYPLLPPLPLPPTALLGRDAELATITRLLARPEVRLVTIVGPPGVGKTRLALEVAAHRQVDYAGGVCLVDLTPIGEPDLVVPAIAQTLDVPERDGQPLRDALAVELRDRPLLLVLDNCEQVLGAAPALAQLLAVCPRLALLATSRAPLRLRGEYQVSLAPLALPDMAQLPPLPVASLAPSESGALDLDTLAHYPAIALFVQRAVAVQPAFALAEETVRDVVEICTRLDGLPLAIELAAARLRLLPLPALAERLTGRGRLLGILAGGARDLPSRQQTLRATVEWSYHLLNEADQRLFRRFAVFAGGFTLAAAESVGDDFGLPKSKIDLLDGLERLADASLLTRVETPAHAPAVEVRFRLLETLRDYALEQFETSGEADGVRERHATYYLVLAEQGQAFLQRPDEEVWFDRLESEQANFRAALQWWTERGNGERALRLGAALSRFWIAWGYRAEGRDRLRALLGMTAAPRRAEGPHPFASRRAGSSPRSIVSPATRANALAAAAMLEDAPPLPAPGTLEGTRAAPAAHALVQEAIAIWRGPAGAAAVAPGAASANGTVVDLAGMTDQGEAVDAGPPATAQAAAMLRAAPYVDDFVAARWLTERAVAIWRQLGDRHAVAYALSRLGLLARQQGEYAVARAVLEESQAISHALGDRRSAGLALDRLGTVVYVQGDLDAARRLYQAASVAFQGASEHALDAWPRLNLGFVALAESDPVAARARAGEVLALRREHGPQVPLVHLVALCAGLAAAEGQHERALRLDGAAESYWRTSPPRERTTRLPPLYRALLDRTLAPARQQLGGTAAAAARAEGVAMTAAHAIAEVTAYLGDRAP